METVDQTIKAIASNPYTVIIALIFTVGPVLWQIGKVVARTIRSLSDSFRTSFRSVRFKEQLNNIRSRVRYDRKIGIFKRMEPSNTHIILTINKSVVQIFFYLFSISVLSLIGKNIGFGAFEAAATFTILYALSVFARRGQEITGEAQVLKFLSRHFHKESRSMLLKVQNAITTEASSETSGAEPDGGAALELLRRAERLVMDAEKIRNEAEQIKT